MTSLIAILNFLSFFFSRKVKTELITGLLPEMPVKFVVWWGYNDYISYDYHVVIR